MISPRRRRPRTLRPVSDAGSPLLNRSTRDQPPGSTFKVITTAAALQAGDNADTRPRRQQTTLPDTHTTLEP